MYVLTGVVAWGEEENGRRGGGWRGDVWTGRLAFEMEGSLGTLVQSSQSTRHGWGC